MICVCVSLAAASRIPPSGDPLLASQRAKYAERERELVVLPHACHLSVLLSDVGCVSPPVRLPVTDRLALSRTRVARRKDREKKHCSLQDVIHAPSLSPDMQLRVIHRCRHAVQRHIPLRLSRSFVHIYSEKGSRRHGDKKTGAAVAAGAGDERRGSNTRHPVSLDVHPACSHRCSS